MLSSWFWLLYCTYISKCLFLENIHRGFSSIQSFSHVQLFATPWAAARQASLSIPNSWSLFKLMPIELVIPSNHLILCCSLLLQPSIFPSIRIFSNESGAQSIGASASASFLPMNIQAWFSLQLTVLISLQSKEVSRVFSSTTIQKYPFFSIQLLYGPTLTSLCDYWKNHSVDYTHLCEQSDVPVFNMLSRFVKAFLPKKEYLLISWMQSLFTVICSPRK